VPGPFAPYEHPDLEIRVTLRCVRPLLVLLLATPLAAQDPRAAADIAKAREALKPIARMAGQWAGEAEVRMGPGPALKVAQSEDISWGASGTVLFIKGTGRDPGTQAVNFEAAGTIWYDAEAGKLRMRTFTSGRSVEPELEIRPDTIVWGFPVPGGRIRYTIALTDDTWHEVGDYLADGRPPMRTIDMRLRRTAR
jgi:hypothetical protein